MHACQPEDCSISELQATAKNAIQSAHCTVSACPYMAMRSLIAHAGMHGIDIWAFVFPLENDAVITSLLRNENENEAI